MFDQIVDIIGIVFGITFLFLYGRASRTLVGSFFKYYHYWMMIGAGFFTAAFLIDYFAVIGGDIVSLDILHHLILLAAAVIFIVVNLRFPREVGQYLNLDSKEGEVK